VSTTRTTRPAFPLTPSSPEERRRSTTSSFSRFFTSQAKRWSAQSASPARMASRKENSVPSRPSPATSSQGCRRKGPNPGEWISALTARRP